MESILVIDDEEHVCEQVRTLLQNFGYACSFIYRPDFLLPRLEEESFDLLLLDINMPGIDGVTLLKQLKAHSNHQKIPVIMLTGDTSEALMAECFGAGATDFITKPISELVLKTRVKNALIEKQAKEALEEKVKIRTTELEQLNQTFQLFVPKPFLDRIRSATFQSGQFEEEVFSILFADIRSYTSYAEQLTPEENFEFLHTFFSLTEPSVTKNQGFVDKFIGDAIMGLFDRKDSADHAIQSAIEMHGEVDSYNQLREKKELPPIEIGIGINTGNVMVGALGSANRLSTTVIGDHVNIASRLQDLTKRYNARILISHYTYQSLQGEDYYIREVDTLKVKGRSQSIQVYDVFEADPPSIKEKKLQSRDLLTQAIAIYKTQAFGEALDYFQQCLDIFPKDGVVFEYVSRCHYFTKFPPSSSWNEGMVSDPEKLFGYVSRNRAERYTLEAKAQIYHSQKPSIMMDSVGEPISGILSNISLSGVQVKLNMAFDIGETTMVIAIFENTPLAPLLGKVPVHFMGRVVWRAQDTRSDAEFAWIIGLETIVVQPDQDQALKQAMTELFKEAKSA